MSVALRNATPFLDRPQPRPRPARPARETTDAPAVGRDDLILDHLWLADRLARRYHHRGVEADDLRQVARTGLLVAARRYRADQGSFRAFATPTIVGTIKRHFRDHAWMVRPPRSLQERALDVHQGWSELAQTLKRDPTDGDLADGTGRSVHELREATAAAQAYRCAPLDHLSQTQPVDDTNGRELHIVELRAMLARVLPTLSVRERRMLHLRFAAEQTQTEIARALGTNQIAVSRELARLLRRLRSSIGDLSVADAEGGRR